MGVISSSASLTVIALASASLRFPAEAPRGFEQRNKEGGLTCRPVFCTGSGWTTALLKDTVLAEDTAVPGCITSIFKKADFITDK